jgi:hypothetical protein
MSFNAKRLYELLPAIYRIRDTEQGEPLKALFDEALSPLIASLEEDLAQLYDDQFIETCADWAIPYIGDLIGDRTLHNNPNLRQVLPKISSPRAEVANTIAYRRRKGTASILEQLARDVTSWDAHVVEFFQLLATTQYLNHLRPNNLYAPDLRRWESLERINTAFDTVSHTLDVRRIDSQRGRYNIPNIGIFLWRINSHFVPGKAIPESPVPKNPALTTARAIEAHPGGYTFNPVGLDAPLFNPPLPEQEITHLAEPRNVPEPLHSRVLYEELETRRQALIDGQTAPKIYFDEDSDYQPFQIVVDDQLIPLEQILICNLSGWQRPPANKNYQPWQHLPSSKDYRRKPIDGTQATQAKPIKVAVDPLLGRLSFPAENQLPTTVEVSFAYGFSMDIGGGFYDRRQSVLALFLPLDRPVSWQVGVTKIKPANPPQLVQTITEAINDWNLQPPGTVGIITVMDSRTYQESIPVIQIPVGSQLLIVAADWPEIDDPINPGQKQRRNGDISPTQLRPHLIGDVIVKGLAPPDPNAPDHFKAGTLILNGLLIEGQLQVQDGNLANLQINHCTLVPVKGGCNVEVTNPLLHLQIDHSICGAITLPDTVSQLTVFSSIIDGLNEVAIVATAAESTIENSTIFGSSNVRSVEASDSIFSDKVVAVRRQVGCVRFSSLTTDSQVPSPYRCQPKLALEKQVKAVERTLSLVEKETVLLRLTPQFTSLRYGDPGYGQLSQRCAVEIRHGAHDESEMGVFHDLYQPQRETNLRVRLDEYLRFGLQAGIFYAT